MLIFFNFYFNLLFNYFIFLKVFFFFRIYFVVNKFNMESYNMILICFIFVYVIDERFNDGNVLLNF